MKTEEIKISGMSCEHCVHAVKKELDKIENLKIDDVRIGSAKVEYDETKVNDNLLEEAIENAGYKIIK
jgi:copper chaperone